ncbi:MAG TPA: Ig-like domain-containing protein, partial [Thermoplasmata archaeon]|nr:Ig-like domain-containing protein [Thermoplasmata archaeon]
TWNFADSYGGGFFDPNRGNASVAMDVDNNRVYVAFEEGPVGGASIVVYSSDDPGFAVSTITNAFSGLPAWNPDIVVENNWGTGNYVYVAYTADEGMFGYNIYASRSVDDGATWASGLILGLGDPTNYEQPATAYGANILYVAYRYNGADIYVATAGVLAAWPYTFTAVNVVTGGFFSSYHTPDIAVTRDGSQAGVVYYVASFLGDFVNMVNSSDQGATWGPGFSGVGAGWGPSISVDFMSSPATNLAGRFHVVWLWNNGTSTSVWHSAADSTGLPGGWTAAARISDTGHETTGTDGYSTAVTTQFRGIFIFGDQYPVALWPGPTFFINPTVYATTPGWTVYLDTNPTGLLLEVDTVLYAAPVSFSWPAWSWHFINAPSPQNVVPFDNQYIFRDWNSTYPQSHLLFGPTTGDFWEVANFTRQWWVTVDTIPPNLTIGINGTYYTAPYSLWWNESELYVLDAPSPQWGGVGAQFVWSQWTDLGTQSHPASVNAVTTFIARFLRELQVELHTSPGDVGPTWTLLVDTVSTWMPATYWWLEGDTHNLEAPQYVVVGGGNRFNFTQWSDGDLNLVKSYNVQDNAPGANEVLTAIYGNQEFEATVTTNPVALSYTVDDIPYSGTNSFWWPAGTMHWLNTTSPQAGLPGEQFVFRDWDGVGPMNYQVMASSTTFVANFIRQFQVTVDTNPPGLAFTIDDVPYGSAATLWMDEGSVHWVNTTSPQAGVAGEQFVFVDWSDGPAMNHQVTADMAKAVTANFQRQYQVTVTTTPAPLDIRVNGIWYTSPQPFWLDAGSSLDLEVNATQQGTLNFQQWSDASTLAIRTVTVTGPTTWTANYTTTLPAFSAVPDCTPLAGQATLVVTCTSTVSGGDFPYTWAWDFGDTQTSILQNPPPHSYATPATYWINVTISDSGTNSTSNTFQILVSAVPLVLDHCTVTPDPAPLQVNTGQQFTAHGWTSTNVEIPPDTANWTVGGGIGTITAAGFFTAGASAGSGTVNATVTYNTVSRDCFADVTLTTTAPPTVAITSPANNAVITTSTVAVAGTSANADRVEVRLDSGVWQAAAGVASWTFSFTGVANGPHTIEARSYFGLIESTPVSVSITVNVAPPTISVANPAEGAQLSGTQQLSGTATPGSIVQIRVDGGAWINVTASGTGSWTYDLATTSYTNAPHTISIKAVLGGQESTTVTRNVTIQNAGVGVPGEFPWWIIILLVIIIAVVLVLLLLMMKRKKKGEPEAAQMPTQPGQPMQPMEQQPMQPLQPMQQPMAQPSTMPMETAAAPAAAAPVGEESVPQKLSRLKDLKDKGLLSQKEYDAKRKELLDKL